MPGYHFRIFDRKDVDVGHLNVRVGMTEHIRLAAGHIGFEIAAEHRGHGYAEDACLATASWIATISEEVLITVDPGNEASIRTIERIGGILIDEVEVPPGDPHFLRGSKRKLRYRWRPQG
ncbi:GNAT family N-acetyltransferase [Verrucomicrobiaceae bacterium 227]